MESRKGKKRNTPQEANGCWSSREEGVGLALGLRTSKQARGGPRPGWRRDAGRPRVAASRARWRGALGACGVLVSVLPAPIAGSGGAARAELRASQGRSRRSGWGSGGGEGPVGRREWGSRESMK